MKLAAAPFSGIIFLMCSAVEGVWRAVRNEIVQGMAETPNGSHR
jgi:hypothetical protein